MKIKEIHQKAGSLSSYAWFFLPVFLWYFLDNIYETMRPAIPESLIYSLMGWGYLLVLVPIVLAGVFGGVYEKQRSPDDSSLSGFIDGVKKHSWRIIVANLLAYVFYALLQMTVLWIAGNPEEPGVVVSKLLEYIDIPFSAILLFWFAAVVLERRVFRGLLLALRTLVLNPYAMLTGIIWGVMRFADYAVADLETGQFSLAVLGARSGILAATRLLATVYALAIYRQARSGDYDEAAEDLSPMSTSATSSDGLVTASFGFAFVSFLPLLHLVALTLGILALKRKQRFVMRSAIACTVGGFFTIAYSLLLIGWVIGGSAPLSVPAYQFLAEVDPDLQPYVALLEQGSYQEVQQQLEQDTANSPDRHWTYDYLSAMAKSQNDDREGAFEDLRIAATKKPERSEFYYYYGLVLLEDHHDEQAAEQFKTALTHEPDLEDASRYLNLINSAYKPTVIVSSLFFIIILLILFTLHEYGHAFAAWKLGDDTAKNQGRLTLNPIPHLDIVGSLLLPVILLSRQSEIILGWAKPVPVNPQNFQDPQRDHMRVSFAGPGVNLIISMVCFIILGCISLLARLLWPETLSLNFATPFSPVSLVGPPFAQRIVILVVFLKQLLFTSLVLGCFNLIPIPPLDGSWIFSGLLPQGFRDFFESTRRYSYVIFILLVVTPVLDYLLSIPVGLAWGALEYLVSVMGFW